MDAQKRRNVCVKCFRLTWITKHHVFPKRFYGRKRNKAYIFLCAHCHIELEEIIPRHTKLAKDEYLAILRAWLHGKQVLVKYKGRIYEDDKYDGLGLA